MVMDAQGRLIMLTDHPQNNILIFNKSGEVVESWTLGLETAHGLSLASDENGEFLLITDFESGRVIKTKLSGEVIFELKTPHELGFYNGWMPYDPTETAVATNGDIYVADGYGSDFIIRYNSKGEYIRHFGGRGAKPENLKNAHGVCIDLRKGAENAELIVTSRMQSCFKRYTLNGEYISTVKLPGTYPCRPVIKGSELYFGVCWSTFLYRANSGCVLILDDNDKVVSCPGGNEPKYNGDKLKRLSQNPRAFYHCHDVCLDDDGNLYICQWNAQGMYPAKLEKLSA